MGPFDCSLIKMNDNLEQTQLWIEAAKMVAADNKVQIPCPNCRHEYLSVEVIIWPSNQKKDIYLKCDNCGQRNTITVNI